MVYFKSSFSKDFPHLMILEVDNIDLWARFQACERNEMIITKNGRCLFPLLKFNMFFDKKDEEPGPDSILSFALSMERVDSYKWKYRHGHWHSTNQISPTSSSAHIEPSTHIYEPESSPATWSFIKQEGLNFSKVKLTNRKGSTASRITRLPISNILTPSSYFSLSSFGYYVPVVYAIDWSVFLKKHTEINDPISVHSVLNAFDRSELEREGSLKCVKVNECSFIAVTHYQNELITHLKKHNNPHAKGFILTNEGIGRVDSVQRGKPGRKKRQPIGEDVFFHDEVRMLPDDVLMASLALEKMSSGSSGHVPRSESIQDKSEGDNRDKMTINDGWKIKLLNFENKFA